FILIFVMFNRHPAIVYGGEGSVTVEDNEGKPVVHSGQAVNICFHRAAWNRLCDSELITRLEVGGRSFDLPTHRISPPQQIGPLPDKKCRAVRIPILGMGIQGPASITGFARSVCWPTDKIWPIETILPRANLAVN